MEYPLNPTPPRRLSLQEARLSLQADQFGYTDEEVLQIMDFIYRLAVVGLALYYESLHETPIIHINSNQREHATKSISISKSKYRRAG